MAERAGLALVSARTLLAKPRQRLLAPLALPALLYRALLSPERRRDLFAEETRSLGVLLGGGKLLLVFSRRTQPRAAAADSASLRRMQQVEVVRRFESPPEQVWKVYTDHAGWSAWAGLGRAARIEDPDRNGVGGALPDGRRVRVRRGRLRPAEAYDLPRRARGHRSKDHFGEVVLGPWRAP
jgi:hypothetical protein